jgi:hypothetical protein
LLFGIRYANIGFLSGVIYATAAFSNGSTDKALLQEATNRLLRSIGEIDSAKPLWTLSYWQKVANLTNTSSKDHDRFPLSPFDMVFEDQVLDRVRQVWLSLNPTGSFLSFEDRVGEVEVEEDTL